MRMGGILLCAFMPAMSILAQATGFGGVYTYVSDSGIAAAIDATVADMNFIKRPIARGRLAKLNPAYRKVALTLTDKEVAVKFDDREPIRMPPDGKPVPWTREDGDKFMVAAQVGKDQLVQTFKNDEGERTNVFKLSPDGKMLTLSATVKSGKLPRPLTYSISFGR